MPIELPGAKIASLSRDNLDSGDNRWTLNSAPRIKARHVCAHAGLCKIPQIKQGFIRKGMMKSPASTRAGHGERYQGVFASIVKLVFKHFISLGPVAG